MDSWLAAARSAWTLGCGGQAGVRCRGQAGAVHFHVTPDSRAGATAGLFSTVDRGEDLRCPARWVPLACRQCELGVSCSLRPTLPILLLVACSLPGTNHKPPTVDGEVSCRRARILGNDDASRHFSLAARQWHPALGACSAVRAAFPARAINRPDFTVMQQSRLPCQDGADPLLPSLCGWPTPYQELYKCYSALSGLRSRTDTLPQGFALGFHITTLRAWLLPVLRVKIHQGRFRLGPRPRMALRGCRRGAYPGLWSLTLSASRA
jgi:hypothetical protein